MQLLSRGGFRLGLGSGENLNEHVVGGGWPAAHVRLDMLEEAVEIIRSLLVGENVNHHGAHPSVTTRTGTRPSPAPRPVPLVRRWPAGQLRTARPRRLRRRDPVRTAGSDRAPAAEVLTGVVRNPTRPLCCRRE
ncbi:LLM class flavin-dependent oxidoreductase [Streptomyces sp. LN245]|uniref:LLM class flavin-dependent oxidoreductase n=1 Tax=Streptomyces sp. LN245 TaxID=3112975 RepID=UPI0037234E5A